MSIQTSEQAELERLREELRLVLDDWNALAGAIKAPTNGGAVGHANALMRELERLRAENAQLLAFLNRPVPKSEWQQLVEENAGLRADKLALLQMLSNVKGIRSHLGWDAIKREYVPTLTLTFSPTPPGDPTKHKGWRDCEEFEATINESVSEQAMQALVDQAQELDMGYGERK